VHINQTQTQNPFNNFLIYTQIHTQKLKNFIFILNNLIWNLQKRFKIPKSKLKTLILKKMKTQTQT